jgi:hypothetical protein
MSRTFNRVLSTSVMSLAIGAFMTGTGQASPSAVPASGHPAQSVTQTNTTDQTANSSATADQWFPTNVGLNLALVGAGTQSNEQSNNNSARSAAGNSNRTAQGAWQEQKPGQHEHAKSCEKCKQGSHAKHGNKHQAEHGKKYHKAEHGKNQHKAEHGKNRYEHGKNRYEHGKNHYPACHGAQYPSGRGSQTVSQDNDTRQNARSTASATQTAPTNLGVNAAILSKGSQSNKQANNNTARSAAGNNNQTVQGSGQSSSGRGGSQTATQHNNTTQTATSTATATQLLPINAAANVAVLSSGSQSNQQANNNSASSVAGNNNETVQLSGQK